MIENLRSWALGLCYAALCAGIVLMITPKSQTVEKSVRFATALFFLLCFFSPLTKLKDYDFSKQAVAIGGQLSEDDSVKSDYLTHLENGLTLLIEKELEHNGIRAEITVELDPDSGGIVIVKTDGGDNAVYLLAEAIIEQKFGLTAEKSD